MSESITTGRPTILRLHQVSARVGLGRSAIYSRIGDGTFPRPVSLGGGAVGWVESEIDAWVSAQIEASRSSGGGLTFSDRAKLAAKASVEKRRQTLAAAA